MHKRKIHDDELLKMHSKGISGKALAAHFQVSPAAVSKRLKKLLPSAEEILNKHSLTEQQKVFVVEKARGRSNAQAVKAAYDVSSTESAKSLGTQLMDNSSIRACIDEIMKAHGLTRSHLIGRLKSHVDNNLDPHLSLKAVDMGLKLTDSYPASKSVNFNLTQSWITYTDIPRYEPEGE